MNKVFLIGNLTKDPELVTTNSGIAMCRFTIAIQRRFAGSDGNRETDFLPIVVWRAQAENCHKYLKKGSKAAVCGNIQTRNYEAQDGTKRYVTEIVAEEVEFLSSKSTGSEEFTKDDSKEDDNSKKAEVSDFDPIDDDALPF